jgi:hypothetical protein
MKNIHKNKIVILNNVNFWILKSCVLNIFFKKHMSITTDKHHTRASSVPDYWTRAEVTMG